MKTQELLVASTFVLSACGRVSTEKLYVSPLHTQQCMLADPCELWASDSFGSGCMLSAKLTYYQSKLMGQLQVCVQKEFPKTNSPAQDTCLRDRAIEGWLRAGLVNLSVTEDIKSTDEIVTPENLITEARKSLDECGKRNP